MLVNGIMRLYHGSHILFDRFDLYCVLTGNNKVKFGYGIYLSSSFRSAAHYSYRENKRYGYVYEVEIPELNDDNSIDFKVKVSDSIIGRAKDRLCRDIPDKAKSNGKCFRLFLASHFGGDNNIEAERKASEFLYSIGVIGIRWPYCWRNPALGLNVAIFNAESIRIRKIFEVQLDSKRQWIEGSEQLIKTFDK